MSSTIRHFMLPLRWVSIAAVFIIALVAAIIIADIGTDPDGLPTWNEARTVFWFLVIGLLLGCLSLFDIFRVCSRKSSDEAIVVDDYESVMKEEWASKRSVFLFFLIPITFIGFFCLIIYATCTISVDELQDESGIMHWQEPFPAYEAEHGYFRWPRSAEKSVGLLIVAFFTSLILAAVSAVPFVCSMLADEKWHAHRLELASDKERNRRYAALEARRNSRKNNSNEDR